MTSSMNADDFKAVEDHLNKEYFFVRLQSIKLIVVGLGVLGLGNIGAAYTAAKKVANDTATTVATTEAANVAAEKVEELLPKNFIEELEQRKSTALAEAAQIKALQNNLLRPRSNRSIRRRLKLTRLSKTLLPRLTH
ncbi:MAG: hypothetical protein R3C20_12655 [Planctomycetaceae bacterium]